MTNNESLYKWVAIILGIAVIVLGILWYQNNAEMKTTLESLEKNTRDYRSEIAEKCDRNATAEQLNEDEDCRRVLADLADVLKEYNDRLQRLIPQATTSTTTAQ